MAILDWQERLLQIAKEHSDAPGEAGEQLRAILNQHEAYKITRDFALAHARLREAIVTMARMALRCGGLLLKTPPGGVGKLIRATDITPAQVRHFVNLAIAYPKLTARVMRKKHFMITEDEAKQVIFYVTRESDLLTLLGINS